jgi:hypothetical protein
MSETTIVALAVAGGVFLVLIITLIKYNVDAAIKMWGVLGVLLAAITSHYFTDQANKDQVAQLQQSNKKVKLALSQAVEKASYVSSIVSPFAYAFEGKGGVMWAPPESENARMVLASDFIDASVKLGEIGILKSVGLEEEM